MKNLHIGDRVEVIFLDTDLNISPSFIGLKGIFVDRDGRYYKVILDKYPETPYFFKSNEIKKENKMTQKSLKKQINEATDIKQLSDLVKSIPANAKISFVELARDLKKKTEQLT